MIARRLGSALLACVMLILPTQAFSLTLGQHDTFHGVFDTDDDVGLHFVNIGGSHPLTVLFETFAYAGGNLRDGSTVGRGGFDPIVSVFDGLGNLLGSNDDGGRRFDAVTGSGFDSFLSLSLAPGNYIAAVTQYNNFPLGSTFADGFSNVGLGNFTGGFGCTNAVFCDVNGDNRSPNYTLEVAPVPVPAALPLLIGGLAAFGFVARGRQTRRSV